MKSENIIVYERDNLYLVYHKDFGNLSVLNQGAMDILNHHDIESMKESIGLNIEAKRIYDELKDNFFIVENQNEEHSILAAEKKKREKDFSSGYLIKCLQLILSNSCNFQCKYCFQCTTDHAGDREESDRKIINMSSVTAEKAILDTMKIIQKNGGHQLTIELFGGEPLANWDTIKYIFDTFGNGEKYGIKLYYTITTNISLLTEEMAAYFSKYDTNVTVSFDSPKNRERVRKDGTNLLDIIDSKMEMLNQYKNNICLNSVISKHTIKDYDYIGLVNFAMKYGVRVIGLILDLDVELITDQTGLDTYCDLLWQTYIFGLEKGIKVTGYWEKIFSQILGSDPVYLESGYKACPATGSKISIEPTGDVFSCKCCTKKLNSELNIADALKSSVYRQYTIKVYDNDNTGHCEHCEISGFCSGVCVGSLEKKQGSFYGYNEALCYIYKSITQRLIENSINLNMVQKISFNSEILKENVEYAIK